jgi:hypothetical protein
MLSKTTIIHLGQIQLPSMQDFEELVGVLDYCVTYNIRLHLVNQAYQDLDVAYQCNRHIIMDSSLETFIDYSRLIDMQALRTINHAIGKEIEGVLDSFYNYQTQNSRSTLNFTGCLINRSNFILSSDIFLRD